MLMKSPSKFITVFIPTFNGRKYLAESIEATLSQELPMEYALELLVIDSGSNDGTLEVLEKYQSKLQLIKIPNSNFGHGKTRSFAAQKAKGEYILFLTQDATPSSTRWLINLIEPFFISEKIGCVFGRQKPRPDSAATIKREVSSVFGSICADDSVLIHRYNSLVDFLPTNPLNTFFSDVNSAVRRELLVGPVPFRDVNYAEDQALAEDMQNKGYLKAYAPLAEVWHSNEYTVKQYYNRKFDEYIGLQEATNLSIKPSKRSLMLGWIRPTKADVKFIFRDVDYGIKSKILWLFKSPFYNIALQKGKYNASKYFNSEEKRKKFSLESKLRR